MPTKKTKKTKPVEINPLEPDKSEGEVKFDIGETTNQAVRGATEKEQIINQLNEEDINMNLLDKIKKNKVLIIAVVAGIILGGLVLWKILGGSKISNLTGNQGIKAGDNSGMQKQALLNTENVSYLTGLPCDNFKRRAIAVMEAGDVSTRPLSGLSEADMVVEMPAITASITRLMGIYVCNAPKEVGSIRSTRHDYITIAKGLDAMLAHWGGSHFALDMLKNKNTVDDLDAMNNPYGAFFRKDGIPAPDNGFATYQGLWDASQKLGYRAENHFEGYPHQVESDAGSRPKGGSLRVGFAGVYGVNYTYDPKTNTYLRTWGGKEDIDQTNGQRLAPKNVVVAFATSRQIEGQYNDVDIEGEGEMHAYMDGQELVGKWIKEKKNCVIGNDLVCMTDSKLKFIKDDGTEVKFVPGQIWLEILEPGQTLKWTPAQ
ncbi:MAG: DUF3048 domain-containing protein [Candidatus Moraniibacteriota bacterium]